MLLEYLPLVVTLVLATGLGLFILILSAWVGPRRPTATKLEPFECGNPSSGTARDRFGVKFYLVAILFLVFDIEAVFIYPWAVVFSDSVRGEGGLAPLPLFLEMLTFMAIMVVGLAYAWRKGALEWGPTRAVLESPDAGGHP